MNITFKSHLHNVVAVLVISILIHVIFCVQVFMALPDAMALNEGLLLFLPHYFFMECLPIPYPLHENSVNYLELWGKLLAAFPASVAYALLLLGLFSSCKKLVFTGQKGNK